MWIRAGGAQSMWIILKFYHIILKSANVDRGGGGKTLIHKMWIKRHFCNPSLIHKMWIICRFFKTLPLQ